MSCPSHDADQMADEIACCTYQPSKVAPTPDALSPVEQHKADLEMVTAACEAAGGTDDSAAIACVRVARLVKALLDRIPEGRS